MKKRMCLLLILGFCLGACAGIALATEESGETTDFDFFDSPTIVSWIEVPLPDPEALALPAAGADGNISFNARVYAFGAEEAEEFHIAPAAVDPVKLAEACWPGSSGEDYVQSSADAVVRFDYQGQSCKYDARSGTFRYLREEDWASADMYANRSGMVKFAFTVEDRNKNGAVAPKNADLQELSRRAQAFLAEFSPDFTPVLIAADQYLLSRNKEIRTLERYEFALAYNGIPLMIHDMWPAASSQIIPGRQMVVVCDEGGLLEMKCSLMEATPVAGSAQEIQLDPAIEWVQTEGKVFYSGSYEISLIELRYLPVAEDAEGMRYAPCWCMSTDTQVPLSSMYMDSIVFKNSACDGTALADF